MAAGLSAAMQGGDDRIAGSAAATDGRRSGGSWASGVCPCLLANGGRRGGVGGDDGNKDELAMETVMTAMESTVAGEERRRDNL